MMSTFLSAPTLASHPTIVCSPHAMAFSKLNPHGNVVRFNRFLPSNMLVRRKGARNVVCSAANVFSSQTLHWISTIASTVLMFSQETAINKSFLPPFFALQAPYDVISWIKSDYGTWTVFLGLLIRNFFLIPGELEKPLLTMLLVIFAPVQMVNMRGTPVGEIVSLVMAGYMAYQHFSRTRDLQSAFNKGTIIPSLALITAVSIPCLFLFPL